MDKGYLFGGYGGHVWPIGLEPKTGLDDEGLGEVETTLHGGCDKAWPNPGGPKAFDTYDLYPVAPEL